MLNCYESVLHVIIHYCFDLASVFMITHTDNVCKSYLCCEMYNVHIVLILIAVHPSMAAYPLQGCKGLEPIFYKVTKTKCYDIVET